MDKVLVMVIVLKVEKDINVCTNITRWLDYLMPGLNGLIAWQKENEFLCDVRATAPAVSCEDPTCRLTLTQQQLMTWYGLFRVLVHIRNNGQSTTLEQCVIMCDTWDRTASSFPAESCVNITKQIRNDFFHVARCRFAFFSPVLVISTLSCWHHTSCEIWQKLIGNKVQFKVFWLHTLPVWHTPSQQTQTGGREQRQFVWGGRWSKGPL